MLAHGVETTPVTSDETSNWLYDKPYQGAVYISAAPRTDHSLVYISVSGFK